MDESKECKHCGDTERPCICDDMEANARARLAAKIAAARTEAALAEREACAALALNRAEMGRLPGEWQAARSEALAIVDAIRARTTPATLSTDTLAALAEARGLRVVTAEHLAELEAAAKTERESCALIADAHAIVPRRVLSSADASEEQRTLASDRVALATNIAKTIRSRTSGGKGGAK